MTQFTIHFATINTNQKRPMYSLTKEFTIHFATINTAFTTPPIAPPIKFTIHFATINTENVDETNQEEIYLQYTLLLLILLLHIR